MSLARLGFMPVLGLLPLLGFGCSDPIPPTPRGAFEVSFASPGIECSVAQHNEELGSISANSKETVIVDGQDSVAVDCAVTGSDTFRVSAYVGDRTRGRTLRIAIPSISAAATKEAPAQGSVAFSSPTTGGEAAISSTDNPCAFWFAPGTGQGIGAGKIWVAFACPEMLLDMSVCAIAQGYAIFENCEA